MDNQQEIFPIVNEEGVVIGCASRGECHGGSRLLHPVVHLHVFNSNGDIYLQRRPEWKDIQPGKWDTSVGGHIDYGETPEEALRREVREELGITDFMPESVDKYVFDSKRERELVYVNRTTYNGEIYPSTEELDGGRFWTMREIREAMGNGVLTPNFESEFKRCFDKELGMMKAVQITEDNANEQLKRLYQTAFPEEEQIPWADLLRLVKEMPLDFTAYYDGEEFIGLTIVYPRPTFNWFWYFAVREELRGKGYGQQILTQLIERYKDCSNILDMESPDHPSPNPEQRKRRHEFYLRNGFRDTHVYRSFDGNTFTIMMMGKGTFTKEDYDEILAELQQHWWPDDMTIKDE